MKYPYAVKANGKWYRPGEDVPEQTPADTAAVEESANLEGNSPVEEVQCEPPVSESEKDSSTAENVPKRRRRKTTK